MLRKKLSLKFGREISSNEIYATMYVNDLKHKIKPISKFQMWLTTLRWKLKCF